MSGLETISDKESVQEKAQSENLGEGAEDLNAVFKHASDDLYTRTIGRQMSAPREQSAKLGRCFMGNRKENSSTECAAELADSQDLSQP